MQGKTIVVTGGLGALGSVVAETAAKRGASVALIDHAKDAPAGFTERLGATALIVGGVDLTSLPAAEQAMASVKAKFGRIDALLNIAGGFQWERSRTASPRRWDRMFALNLKTALNACKAALPYFDRERRRPHRQCRRCSPLYTPRPGSAPMRRANPRCIG